MKVERGVTVESCVRSQQQCVVVKGSGVSLTIESYSEEVSWLVMKHESRNDPKKLEGLEKYAEQEARPTYALDRRIVVRSF